MNNMSVRSKLTWTFGGLSLMVLVVAGVAIKTLQDANQQFESYVNGVAARANIAHLVREAIDLRAIAARNLVLVTKPEDVATEKAVVTKAHADVSAGMSQLIRMAEGADVIPEARRLILEMEKIEKSYGPVALGIVELALGNQRDAAIAKMNDECRPLLAALVKVSTEYSDLTKHRSEQLVAQAQAQYASERNLLIAASVLVLLGAMVAGALITRSLLRTLGAEPAALCEAVARVADGDLTEKLSVDNRDTTSVLAVMQRMQTSLVGVVSTVRSGSESVATASAQIASGNNDLSARTEQQASALQQTAASMEELSSTVKQNADSALQANQLALSASTTAVRGGEVVAEVVDTMKGINDSSKKIADIISVIDGIAFQTNILALNAAVEAARAGEQGRGFAVVASEVRSLAGRSAEAAKEIKGLINASVERVEQGTALVDRAGTTMTEVVAAIKRVTDLMGEISAASHEQSAGVHQVGEAVTQMDQVTQQNAALVEEMAAAASSLKSQAQDLVQTVAVFKLAPGAVQSHAATPAKLTHKPMPKPLMPPRPRIGTAPKALDVKPSSTPQAQASASAPKASAEEEDWTTF